ncbi:hypothetical protein G6F32_016451 [Rhizopus arrhizus]|nr:hypothetical protein G6F32_016451 [Rhizopus arrhizus]
MARPSAVSAPDTAKLLLPTASASSCPVPGFPCNVRRSSWLASGSTALPVGSPNRGASHSLPSWTSRAYSAGGTTARMRLSASSVWLPGSCRSAYMASPVSTLSLACQGCGACRSSRDAQGRTDNPARPSLTPAT